MHDGRTQQATFAIANNVSQNNKEGYPYTRAKENPQCGIINLDNASDNQKPCGIHYQIHKKIFLSQNFT